VAGSRIPAGPQGALKVPAGTAAAEPVTTVRCEFCKVLGPSSLIPDIGRGPRCADTDACVRRWADGGIPRPLPGAGHDAAAYYTPMPGAGKAIANRFGGEGAEPPAALPEAQERALGDFLAAHDEEDARTAEAAPEPDEHDISDEEFEAARADLIARFGAIPPSLQRVIDMGGRFGRAAAGEEPGDAPAAEPGSENEEPEPAVAEAPAPVAEDEPALVPEDDVEPESARPVETISLPEPADDPVPAAEDSPEPAQDETAE